MNRRPLSSRSCNSRLENNKDEYLYIHDKEDKTLNGIQKVSFLFPVLKLPRKRHGYAQR